MLLGYTVAKAPTSPINSTWFPRPFLLVRGWGLGTRQHDPRPHHQTPLSSCSVEGGSGDETMGASDDFLVGTILVHVYTDQSSISTQCIPQTSLIVQSTLSVVSIRDCLPKQHLSVLSRKQLSSKYISFWIENKSITCSLLILHVVVSKSITKQFCIL